eukprot:TRINITY_DN30129_c0_g1_i1.p1 TRINITY_DN30129_c0_g1~~TRINITY_DN30129_c0_g1_i1.p1  ORF type:complete len:152 (+),score=14.14 TRINITY_DN30129_c0_g1_i1:321-776(+)
MQVERVKDSSKFQTFQPLVLTKIEDLNEEIWKLQIKKMVSRVHAVFQFPNEKYKIVGVLPFFDDREKHYTLVLRDLQMSKNSACIYTPSDTLVPHYLKLLEAFLLEEDFDTPFPDINLAEEEYLELYFKIRQRNFQASYMIVTLGKKSQRE